MLFPESDTYCSTNVADPKLSGSLVKRKSVRVSKAISPDLGQSAIVAEKRIVIRNSVFLACKYILDPREKNYCYIIFYSYRLPWN